MFMSDKDHFKTATQEQESEAMSVETDSSDSALAREPTSSQGPWEPSIAARLVALANGLYFVFLAITILKTMLQGLSLPLVVLIDRGFYALMSIGIVVSSLGVWMKNERARAWLRGLLLAFLLVKGSTKLLLGANLGNQLIAVTMLVVWFGAAIWALRPPLATQSTD